MATGYHYLPLSRARQEIRLLCFDTRLTSGTQCLQSDTPLRCTIKHISTLPDPLPEFYAVSYTWGDSKTRGSLLVDGIPVTVPQNAETALRNLLAHQIEQRSKAAAPAFTDLVEFAESPSGSGSGSSGSNDWQGTEIRFWLDAICINQHDLEEKAWQLLLISDIYSQCQEVCIWLDEDDEGIANDIQPAISSIVEQCKSETNDLVDLFDTVWSVNAVELSPRATKKPSPTLSNLQALRAVYSSPWFQRLWVLQECVLARTAKCYRGTAVVPFLDIALAGRWLWYKSLGRLSPDDTQQAAHSIGIQNAATMWDLISTPFVIPRVLSNLLLLGMRFDVTDPRDKIYALLGLLNDDDFACLREELLPDYSISLPELYTRMTRAIIDDTQSLFIMKIGSTLVPATDRVEDALEMPSWVPRFDWVHEASKGSPSAIRGVSRATSSDFGIRVRTVDGLPSVLTIQGMMVDQIAHTAKAPWVVTKQGMDTLKSQISSAWTMTMEYGREEACGSLPYAFAVTVCAGRNRSLQDAASDPQFAAKCAPFFISGGPACKQLGAQLLAPRKDSAATNDVYDEEMPLALAQNSRNLRFFITSSGRLGMGPKASRAGDKVCIVPGCDVPVIMRQEGVFWKYVGDAYVYGLMDGEYFREKATLGRLEAEMQWFNVH